MCSESIYSTLLCFHEQPSGGYVYETAPVSKICDFSFPTMHTSQGGVGTDMVDLHGYKNNGYNGHGATHDETRPTGESQFLYRIKRTISFETTGVIRNDKGIKEAGYH